MATVRLETSPTPAHVRTARLVATALARRAGIVEPVLDEIRLAVGEACSRAVGQHQRYGIPTPIRIDLVDAPRFTVAVTDSAPTDSPARGLDLAGSSPEAVALAVQRQAIAGAPTAEPSELVEAQLVDAELAEESIAAGVGLALLASLVDDLSIEEVEVGQGTTVRMSWPLGPVL